MVYKAVYSRHGGRYAEDCESFDAAVSFLQNGSDYGALFQVCIVDPDGRVFVEESPTFDISEDIEPILKDLYIPYSSERGTFVLS